MLRPYTLRPLRFFDFAQDMVFFDCDLLRRILCGS